MTRQYIIQPRGLVTQPNKVGQFDEGAMLRADTLRMRDPGELQPFKVNSQYAPGAGGTGQYLQRLFSTGSQLIGWKSPIPATGTFRADWSTAGAINQANAAAGHGSAGPICFPARITPVLFRGRTLFNEQKGVSVFDYVNPSTATERQFRWAQLPVPRVTNARIDSLSSGLSSINPGKAVTVVAVLRRKYADGYELISAPSNFVRVRNFAAVLANIIVSVDFPFDAELNTGDTLEIYRSPEVDAPTSGLDIDPGTKVYQVASNSTLTPGTTGISVTIRAAANTIVGDALYTNQYTLQSSKHIPPIARCLGSFKNYMFYANTTLPAQWRAQFPNGLGLLSTASQRQFGVGLRKFTTGTFTNGNPTITGISAAEMVGVEVGQFIWDGDVRIPATFPASSSIYPQDARIQSFTVNSITMTVNAKSSGAPSPDFVTADALEVDGTPIPFPDVQGFLLVLGFGSAGFNYALISDSTIAYRDADGVRGAGTTFGQGIALQCSRQVSNGGTLTIRGTSGANYMPPIPALTQTVLTFSAERKPNYVHWSWEQQPESVPPGNFEPVSNGEIDALITTRDAMWIWTSEGLWRWTGYGTLPSGIQANWRVDLIDKTIRLAGPGAVCAMGEKVFAYTNQGFVCVSDSEGLRYLSRGVIGDLIPGAAWSETPIYSMAADPVLNEVWLNIATPTLNIGDRVLTIVWSDLWGVFTALNQRIGDDNNNYITALEFASHTGVVMLGVSSFAVNSGIVEWHDPAGNTYGTWTADFQAVYGPAPMAAKQWQDVTAMFDPASAGRAITPRFNEISGGYTNPVVQYPNAKDARVSFGVPITAPAVAEMLAFGLSGAQVTGITKFRGLSPRYALLAEQQLVR